MTGNGTDVRFVAHGEPKQLTFYKSGMIWDFDWSRDGKKVAISRGANASDVVLFTAAK